MLTYVIILLLVFAAWRDLLTRTIPDLVSIGILVIGFAVRSADGWGAVGLSLLVAVVLFLLLLPLNSRGLLGGADLKLLAALAAGLAPIDTYNLIAFVALTGGLLAIAYLAMRTVAKRLKRAPSVARAGAFRRFIAIELWRIRKGAALPYGVAIAAGALVLAFGPSGV